jgi:hypothetical protein
METSSLVNFPSESCGKLLQKEGSYIDNELWKSAWSSFAFLPTMQVESWAQTT